MTATGDLFERLEGELTAESGAVGVDENGNVDSVAGEDRKTVRLREYEYSWSVYAQKIFPELVKESGVKKIKRWVARGREVRDMPPLDDLPRMATWYERYFRNKKAPKELRRFEEGAADEAVKEEGVAEEASLPPMQLLVEEGMESDMGLVQARTLVASTYRQMEIALERGNLTQYKSLSREWQSLVNTLRQWEKDAMRIQEGRGDVLRTRVVNSELVRIFTATGQSFFAALQKVLQDHAPDLPPDERRKVALRTRDEVFQHLRGSRFETAWTGG